MSPAAAEKEGRRVMALTLRNSWKAGAAGLAALSMLPGAAQADDQAREYASVTTSETPQKVSFATAASSTIPLTQDADGDALLWTRDNEGIAVAVYLGTESKVTPETITQILLQDFKDAGVENVQFFFEQNDVPATGVTYIYNGVSDGVFTLGNSRPAVPDTAAQFKFYQEHPELGF